MIPEHLSEITADWLTGALRERGHLPGGRISALTQEVLGEGEGFMGVIARLHLTFEGTAGAVPETLIAKLPTPVQENRVIGEILGAYWREIHFYEELSEEMPIPVPRLFYADLTPDSMRRRQNQISRFLDRLPTWVLSRVLDASGRIVERNAHRYVLLIEDLAPAQVGDQLVGGSLERCTDALEAAARMHAAFWQSPALEAKFWLAAQRFGARTRHRMYTAARETFCTRHAALLGTEDLAMLEWMDEHGEAISAALHTEPPSSLLHCDLRLDNIFFDEANADRNVVLADWQLAGAGAAAYDIAYLLSGTLLPEVSRAQELELLRGYHETLHAHGVEGYSLEDLQRDYGRALFSVLVVLATTNEVDMGDARGVTLIDQWTERLLARLRHVDRDALVRSLPTRRRK